MPRVLLFKVEGEIDNEPYGPAKAVNEGEDFNAVEVEWVALATAQNMADTLGLELRRS